MMHQSRFPRRLLGLPRPDIGFEKDRRRGDSTSRTEEHVNGLEYVKGMLKVVIRVLVTIDVSHVEQQILDLI
jgi:hypothetical protein